MAEMANVVGGEIITDEWGNLIRSRTVQRYATVAARTAGHPTPTAGDLSYLQDSGDLDVYHGGTWEHIGPPVATVQMLAGGSVPNGGWSVTGPLSPGPPMRPSSPLSDPSWGAGDGTTTFNLPDMRGRYPRGVASYRGRGRVRGRIRIRCHPPHPHCGSTQLVDHRRPPPEVVVVGLRSPETLGTATSRDQPPTFGSGGPEQTSILSRFPRHPFHHQNLKEDNMAEAKKPRQEAPYSDSPRPGRRCGTVRDY